MRLIIFDFNRTLFNPDTEGLESDALTVLKKLSKDHKLALITTELGQRGKLIKKLGLEKHFDKIVFTKEKNVNDFLVCCKDLNIEVEQTAIVGDRLKGEIFLGNQLGMFTIHFKKGKFSTELAANDLEKPSLTIKKLSQLLKYDKLTMNL